MAEGEIYHRQILFEKLYVLDSDDLFFQKNYYNLPNTLYLIVVNRGVIDIHSNVFILSTTFKSVSTRKTNFTGHLQYVNYLKKS